MLFFVLLFLHVTVQAMEKLPTDVFLNGIALRLLPSTTVDAKPLTRWSEIYKKNKDQCTDEELYELYEPFLKAYTNKIEYLASNSWFSNISDLTSLACVNKKYYHIIHGLLSTEEMHKYSMANIEKFKKTQLYLSLNELDLSSNVDQNKFIGAYFPLNKKLCKKDCQVNQDYITLQHCLYLNKEQNDIHILIAVTFGHGKCLEKSEGLFIEQSKEGYHFSCQQFGDFLFDIGNLLTEENYKKK